MESTNNILFYSAIGVTIGLCFGIVATVLLNNLCFKNGKVPKWAKIIVGVVLILGFSVLGCYIGLQIGCFVSMPEWFRNALNADKK